MSKEEKPSIFTTPQAMFIYICQIPALIFMGAGYGALAAPLEPALWVALFLGYVAVIVNHIVLTGRSAVLSHLEEEKTNE